MLTYGSKLMSLHSYDQSIYGSTKHLHRSAYERLVVTQLDAALEIDLVTDQLYAELCRAAEYINPSYQPGFIKYLNDLIPGASFTLEVNPNAEPSTQATIPDSFDHVSSVCSTLEHQNEAPIIPTSSPSAATHPAPRHLVHDWVNSMELYLAHEEGSLSSLCDEQPEIPLAQSDFSQVQNSQDSEIQPIQRTISCGNRTLTLPPVQCSTQPPLALSQSGEQPENPLAQPDFSQVQGSRDSEKTTPIVQRSRALIPSRLQCDPSNTTSTTTATSTTPTPLQLRNCADGSVDCAVPSTTSTTTSTIINQTIHINDTFVYDHDHQFQQLLPMYFNLYFQIQSQVRIRKIDANHDIQRCRVIKILQLLTFGPDIEPEPPPPIPLVVGDHSKCLNQGA